jgi:hypothetical protein
MKSIDKKGNIVYRNSDGLLHREDGPAFEHVHGTKVWYINGLRHRENGPAIENGNGIKKWYINGVSYTEQEYKYKTRSRKLKLLFHTL